MNSFWLSFIVAEALSVAEAFVATSTVPPAVKLALQNFIVAGQALALAIQTGV